jgi:ABC-type sulfate/molybdate transport systems ATPase subunit
VAILSADFELPLRSFDLTLALEVERTVALVGPSGSGKSSALRSIAGLVRPRGRIALDDEVWLDERTFRPPEERRVGLVFQEYALFPHLTVERNVAFGGKERVGELLERFRISHLAGARPGELSGGERQRVAIARALAAKPDLLVCDEVTSALDVSVQAAVLELLSELQRDLRLSMLFITHNLGVVACIGDSVLVMDQGTLRESGPCTQVLSAPTDDYTRRLLSAAPRLPDAAVS